MPKKSFKLRPATTSDIPSIMHLIRELALYEKAPERVEATEAMLEKTMFGERSYAEVVLAVDDAGQAIGMALFVGATFAAAGRELDDHSRSSTTTLRGSESQEYISRVSNAFRPMELH